MKNGKAVLNLVYQLKEQAPLATLFVTFDSPRYGSISVEVTPERASWREAGLQRYREDNGIRVQGKGPDIPASAMTELKHQFQEEAGHMTEFYQAALNHLAPELVLKQIEGNHVSWRDEFKKVMLGVVQEINEGWEGVGAYAHSNVALIDTVEYVLKNGHGAKLRLNYRGPNAHPIQWETLNWERDNAFGDPAVLYLSLKKVLDQSERWKSAVKGFLNHAGSRTRESVDPD